jgi:zona occludens toxin (predicted ATPase)
MNTSGMPKSLCGHSPTEHIIQTTARNKQLIRISLLCKRGVLVGSTLTGERMGSRGIHFIEEANRNTIFPFNGPLPLSVPKPGLEPGDAITWRKGWIQYRVTTKGTLPTWLSHEKF